MKRPCSVCHTLSERHVFEDVDGQVIEAFCDDHCPRCWTPPRKDAA